VENKFTKEAKEIWESFSKDFQLAVLKSVFCVSCLKAVEIVEYKGVVENGLVVLDGKCKTCGHDVSRVVD